MPECEDIETVTEKWLIFVCVCVCVCVRAHVRVLVFLSSGGDLDHQRKV